jgi:DNA-binding FadR family transcriptional regulator
MTSTEVGTVSPAGVDANAKRAAKVAGRIVEDITALGWPVGQVLGSEAELLARYQVSRAVFREAVRLVEHQQVARTRRGPGGGLVVTEPGLEAVIDAVVRYLHQVAARLDEVFEARIILEGIASELAAERSGEDESGERRNVDAGSAPSDADVESPEFHALVTAVSGNACLDLFVNVLSAVTQRYSVGRERSDPDDERDASRAHARIAEAIASGNGRLAAHRMREHLQAQADLVRRRRTTRQLLPDSVVLGPSTPGKGAEIVAGRLSRFIVSERLQPGQLVGTEHELIAREGVSRALLREAVRLLEHQQVARMRRGPGGGLFVLSPGTDAVTDMATIYLARQGMPRGDVAACRVEVESIAASFAAQRRNDEGTVGLEKSLAWGEHAGDEWEGDVHDFHAAVSAAAGNQVLHLVIVVLIRLSRRQEGERSTPKARKRDRAEVLLAHQDVARAIENRQEDLARDRMRDHLSALGVREP